MDENGNSATAERKPKTIFGKPCEGCTNRRDILVAGNWQMDAIVLGFMFLLILGILVLKYTSKSES